MFNSGKHGFNFWVRAYCFTAMENCRAECSRWKRLRAEDCCLAWGGGPRAHFELGGELSGREFARRALLLNAWLYFGLNYAFFNFPWPWLKWTARTPNAIAFTVCVLGLTLACLTIGRSAVTEKQNAQSL